MQAMHECMATMREQDKRRCRWVEIRPQHGDGREKAKAGGT